jgi:hypothetical protein
MVFIDPRLTISKNSNKIKIDFLKAALLKQNTD